MPTEHNPDAPPNGFPEGTDCIVTGTVPGAQVAWGEIVTVGERTTIWGGCGGNWLGPDGSYLGLLQEVSSHSFKGLLGQTVTVWHPVKWLRPNKDPDQGVTIEEREALLA